MPSVMSASRPAALSRGPRAKPKSPALAWRGSRPAAANRAATPGCIRPARIRFSPCATRQRLLRSRRTTSATVPSATRSSRASSRGCVRNTELAALAQLGAQRQQHVEGDADAGELLAREAAARLARIDDHVGLGQSHLAVDDRRQVVVGDHHREPVRRGMGDAFEAGDAVVDRQQHVGRLALEREVDDRRRQPVAVDAPVGHDVGERRRVGAEHAQAAQHDGAGGRAVAVVVGDDADPAAGADRVGEQPRGRGGAEQARRRQQARQAVVELVGGLHAAGGEQARQQRMHARLLERPGGARRHVAGHDRHRRQGHASSEAFEHGVRLVRAASAGAGAAAGPAAATSKRAALRSPHRVRTASCALGAGDRARRRAAARPRPRPPSRRRAAARAATRRRSARRRRPSACARPQPLSQNEFTTGSPRASRASFTGWAWKTSWASLCRRRIRRPDGRARLAQPAVDVAADHAVERGAWRSLRARRGRRTSARARPRRRRSLRFRTARGSPRTSARDSASPRPSPAGSSMVAWSRPSSQCAGVTRPQARSPTATPSASGGRRGERQGAVAAAPAAGGGEGALVRRREAVGRAVVAGRGREPHQQAREVRQGEVAKHVPAGFRIVGSEGNEQVHGRIIRGPAHCASAALLTGRPFSRTLGS